MYKLDLTEDEKNKLLYIFANGYDWKDIDLIVQKLWDKLDQLTK